MKDFYDHLDAFALKKGDSYQTISLAPDRLNIFYLVDGIIVGAMTEIVHRDQCIGNILRLSQLKLTEAEHSAMLAALTASLASWYGDESITLTNPGLLYFCCEEESFSERGAFDHAEMVLDWFFHLNPAFITSAPSLLAGYAITGHAAGCTVSKTGSVKPFISPKLIPPAAVAPTVFTLPHTETDVPLLKALEQSAEWRRKARLSDVLHMKLVLYWVALESLLPDCYGRKEIMKQISVLIAAATSDDRNAYLSILGNIHQLRNKIVHGVVREDENHEDVIKAVYLLLTVVRFVQNLVTEHLQKGSTEINEVYSVERHAVVMGNAEAQDWVRRVVRDAAENWTRTDLANTKLFL